MRHSKTDRAPRPNSIIDLGKEKIRFPIKGKTVSRTARMTIPLLPSPTLRLEINLGRLSDNNWIFLDDIGPEAVLVESNTTFRVFGLRVKGRQLILTPARVPIRMKVDPAVELRRIRFQLFNFPDFYCFGQEGSELGLTDENAGEHRRVGALDVRAAGWRIVITGDMTTKETVATLREKGGYGATQNGEICRADGSVFPWSEGETILSCLHSFLSFARGQWVCPGLAVGEDEQDEVVWREWGLGRLDPWGQPVSWFDTDHGEVLHQVFPGFYRLWKKEVWHRPLRDCLYWYLRSNGLSRGAGPDGGLILTLPALELLSWTHLVQDKRCLSKSEFKRRLGAKDRMRRLLEEFLIPLSIPHSLAGLREIATQEGWKDGPDTLMQLRNRLVHPSRKKPADFSKAWFEAWTLAQWYLELCLLRLCGHQGVYGNRTSQNCFGDAETVPWRDSEGPLAG